MAVRAYGHEITQLRWFPLLPFVERDDVMRFSILPGQSRGEHFEFEVANLTRVSIDGLALVQQSSVPHKARAFGTKAALFKSPQLLFLEKWP
jgi:hypothetical protein